ncbi:MAG: UDP-3-O-(3-hydroxymyristoyl)glucosamine N-acyltransferase [Bacteroidaceae bacterium]|nr:UDP-3-O-(3-hydroxymyristoyl)glucosamine N-acyltransferase [Bacteroidaceae bacterium]
MQFTAQQIAAFLGGEVVGDAQVSVSNLAKIEEGTPGTLTFLSNPLYTQYIYTTQASIVLVRRDFQPERPVTPTLIKVDDPYSSLTMLLELVNQATLGNKRGIESPAHISDSAQLPDDAYVGAFAYVGERVVVGSGVKIYPQVYVGDDVTIGDNVILYPGVKIYHGCRIGNNCIIHAGTVIGSDGFGFAPQPDGSYKKIPQIGIVIIEDNVEIGANTTIDRATMGATIIHRGVKLDNLIQLAHNVEVGENTVMAAQVGVAGSSKIGAQCMFGGQVGVAGHRRVGSHVNVGAQTGIPNDVKDNMEIMGYPAVPKIDFARQTIHVKRLPELNNTVKQLQREIEELKKLINNNN